MMKKLILASASPRRAELMEKLHIPFEIAPADCDEHLSGNPLPEEAVVLLSRRKAEASAKQFPGQYVLGADTLVALDGKALGKPRDRQDAVHMIGSLAGRTHCVWTGMTLISPDGKYHSALEGTEVTFGPMSREEVCAYVDSGESMDKAGAYALQGQAAIYIQGIKGCPYNAIGLPIYRLRLLLKEAGWEAEA